MWRKYSYWKITPNRVSTVFLLRNVQVKDARIGHAVIGSET